MDDWRNKPRTGKSQVTPWLQQIQARINMGATMKQAYDELMSNESISLGYRQFVRYVHTLTSNTQATTQKTTDKQTAIAEEHAKTPPEPKKADNQRTPMTPADFRKIREDFDRMDLNALVSGKGLIFDEK
ncbi:hypothetical protein [Pseudomonas amygdali]|uniref:hypothetical protein n=1 Tax=Pseudomonas amygdali TaxID=47877 RepID=UPI0001CC3E37|nr:hypothetical protein [Pseudomonas amygdali]KWT13184.1 hypothetical protein AL041_14905 [Pseudomonas amygdali pv. aesculi]KWT20199.1 hypothetical protein AL044_00130 [Pseudomonas amygdali pv. aesculi]KWT23864.1 hypothetical protein AL043_21820 [Pseudomonas amygdali pv. aesculi]KWT27847.1 hypothetical protein AL042_13075 [Pseudomonas amygdali pv. aesculi]KWT34370.1 hypothetical protein AL045_27320 [Pseudomonas amygdali pv. aesculi]